MGITFVYTQMKSSLDCIQDNSGFIHWHMCDDFMMHRIECSPVAVCLEDWILDMSWLNGDGDSTCKVAAVTAHNVVHVIECSDCSFGKERSKHHCEVSCILYPIIYYITVIFQQIIHQ